jgi:hypothetical protein
MKLLAGTCSLDDLIEYLVAQEVPLEQVRPFLIEFGKVNKLQIEVFSTPEGHRFFIVQGCTTSPLYLIVYKRSVHRYYEHNPVPADLFFRAGLSISCDASEHLRSALIQSRYLTSASTLNTELDPFELPAIPERPLQFVRAVWTLLKIPDYKVLTHEQFAKEIPHFMALGPLIYRKVARMQIDPSRDIVIEGVRSQTPPFNFLRECKRIASIEWLDAALVEITMKDGHIYYLETTRGIHRLFEKQDWELQNQRGVCNSAPEGSQIVLPIIYGDTLLPSDSGSAE